MKRGTKGKTVLELASEAKCSIRKLSIMELLVESSEHLPTHQLMFPESLAKANSSRRTSAGSGTQAGYSRFLW